MLFKVYDTASIPGCTYETPEVPSNNSNLATTTNPNPMVLTNLQASAYFNFQLCNTDPQLKIKSPYNYLIYFESLINGVPSTLTCEY